ncbi:unnamed protein product [Cylindrotheca closterium]|uniref:Serine/threonine-protein phosphatase 4 regulatory subunit 3-like central domain-containing protein n=1 Tax=Cylindrotheca closterium TaxID=2856 RepID=A0AAD2FZU0_9STRA|nr:unnamed protein product [Cylindrotheca closterium]
MSSESGKSDDKKVLHGFHMQIPTQQPKLHKKRKRELGSTLDLSSSSSSSSDEDEDTKRAPSSMKRLLGNGKGRELHAKEEESSGSATPDEPLNLLRKGPAHLQAQQPEGWRVKLYRLNADGSWDDCGTGRIACLYKQQTKETANAAGDAWIYQELKEPTLCMQSEVTAAAARILLRTRILLRDAYQRQGENIITWCEPYLEDGNASQGVDLALSFQDNSGCLDIWRQITQVQSKAAELFRRAGVGASVMNVDADTSEPGETTVNVNQTNGTVGAVTHTVAVPHPTSLQQQEAWVNVASKMEKQSMGGDGNQQMQQMQQHFEDSYNENSPLQQPLNLTQSPQLPNPPTLQKLEEIADTIASIQHLQQREALAMFISQNECQYLKSLISLFPSAEARGDYASLATLAACAKTILLLNDPALIELIVSDAQIFEDVCATLEYDPDLRDKANHRWFLRERAKFRTVVLMDDEELVEAIHRSFRVTYLRDTLLRPTMDESSLSTLSSLQTFTHADVVKGVTKSPVEAEDKSELLKDSYLAKIIRVLGRELLSISALEWEEVESLPAESDVQAYLVQRAEDIAVDASTVATPAPLTQSRKATIWKQHLMPQDVSLVSRRARRRGSLSFLRELFNMVRNSLQQTDQDDFFAVLVSMEVDLSYGEDGELAMEENNKGKVVNLLSLLGTILSDPNIDVTEKGSALEIVAGIAVHDTSLIRSRCLDCYESAKMETSQSMRPRPNEKKHIIFQCPPNDLLASLLFLLATEIDAGVLLQVSEIMRIILDTDMMGDHGPMGASFSDKSEEIPPSGQNTSHEHPNHQSGSTTEQNKFLSMFYEHYIQWLAAPFQYAIFYPLLRMRKKDVSHQPPRVMMQALEDFEKGSYNKNQILRSVPLSALRSSFAVELLSFCVRAHVYRMKCYLLRSGILGSVLRLLKPANPSEPLSGDRCLKLAALRFLREILSVNDEFYHRHIIQHNLFGPVFEAFRANPVGDNLVSSATVEMCDFIHSENINSLIEHIVTKHLSVEGTTNPSLEDLSSTYVNTLTVLRTAYEKNLKEAPMSESVDGKSEATINGGTRYTGGSERTILNEKASEDQRKFREVDNEEAYFEGDDDDPSSGDYRSNTQDGASNLFSFVQTSMTRGGSSSTFAGDQQTAQGKMEEKCPGN